MSRVLGDGWLVPALDDGNRAFFTRGAVVLRRCEDCGVLSHPPDDVCGSCQGTRFGEFESAGRGRIESVAVVHHPVHPALADACPYAVVVVSLDDAPTVHLIGNVVGTPPGEIAIGQAVRAVFEEVGELRIPQWEPC